MKNTLYAINERRNKILSIVNDHKEVTVEYLAQLLNVTTVTIRRDLDFLASEQKIARIFGGAKKISPEQVTPTFQHETEDKDFTNSVLQI